MESTTRDVGGACAPGAKTGWLNRRILYIGLALAAGAGMLPPPGAQSEGNTESRQGRD